MKSDKPSNSEGACQKEQSSLTFADSINSCLNTAGSTAGYIAVDIAGERSVNLCLPGDGLLTTGMRNWALSTNTPAGSPFGWRVMWPMDIRCSVETPVRRTDEVFGGGKELLVDGDTKCGVPA